MHNMKKIPYTEEKQFRSIFGINLTPYWDHFTGFDIIKFDQFMRLNYGYIEDGKTSLSDFITLKYGTEAEGLIRSLIAK